MVTHRSLLGAICGGWLSFLLCGPRASLSRHNIVIDTESMGENICNWMGERDAHIQAVERGRYQGRLIDATVIPCPSPVTHCDMGRRSAVTGRRPCRGLCLGLPVQLASPEWLQASRAIRLL